MLPNVASHLWKMLPVALKLHGCRSLATCSVHKNQHYDVIISGGGMVGFAMGCSLGNSPYLSKKKALLVESTDRPKVNLDSYGLRTVALNPGSKELLQSLGVWKHIEKVRFGPVRKMQVWDACSDAMITFGKADLSEEIAYIVENDLILDALTKEADSLKGPLEVLYKSRIMGYQTTEDCVKVTLGDGTELTTSLVIGADGFNSGLRQVMAGQQYMTSDYHQMAIVATLKLSEVQENVTAWQRFLPTGPVALLPLSKEHSSLVWSTNRDAARRLLEMPTESFVDALNQALWNDADKNPVAENVSQRVGEILRVLQSDSSEESVRQLPPGVADVVGKRAAFPLGIGHAVNYVADRMALVGDAAHRVHPMAGLGVNLGFGDVMLLTEVINRAVRNGADFGTMLYLKDYESGRQRHNVPVLTTIHGLHHLYQSTWTPIVMARSLGFTVLDKFPAVKKFITKSAST